MTKAFPPSPELLSITDVERQTGIRQGTLRVWEKRYGFPQPLRDLHGDRVYPAVQVERLQAVKRLLDQGHRPGKILPGGGPDVEHVAAIQSDPDPLPAEHQHVFNLLRGYRRAELHGHFQYRLLELGLRRFVIEYLAPLTAAVGVAWSVGRLPVRSEHFFTQVASATLHAKQAAVRTNGDGAPKVILATLTGESHGLGIMMAEAVMATLQMECIQLGCDTSPAEVLAAARESSADIVALSFSSYFPYKVLGRTLAAIRATLPATTAVWVGGSGVAAPAVLAPAIERFDTLDAIEPALLRWRAIHAVRAD